MDYIYKVAVPLSKNEIKEFEEVIIYKKESDIFINKKINISNLQNLNITISYIDNNRLIFSMFLGKKYVSEIIFEDITKIQQVFNVFRFIFDYKGIKYLFYLKLEIGDTFSDDDIVKKNVRELEILNFMVKNDDVSGLGYYITFVDLNSLLNIIYCSYSIIGYYLLNKDEKKTFDLIEIFINKLERIGIYADENIDFEKEVSINLGFVFGSTFLSIEESVFTLIKLLTYKDSELIKKTIEKVIPNETRLFQVIKVMIKTNIYIHLL